MKPKDTQPALVPANSGLRTKHHSPRDAHQLKPCWRYLCLLSLLLLGLSHALSSKAADVPGQNLAGRAAANQDGERQANSDTAAAPSLDLLLFLADWNDGDGWLDPVALERVMRESSDQDETQAHLLSSESGVEEHDDH